MSRKVARKSVSRAKQRKGRNIVQNPDMVVESSDNSVMSILTSGAFLVKR
jgi:hypothetical protein